MINAKSFQEHRIQQNFFTLEVLTVLSRLFEIIPAPTEKSAAVSLSNNVGLANSASDDDADVGDDGGDDDGDDDLFGCSARTLHISCCTSVISCLWCCVRRVVTPRTKKNARIFITVCLSFSTTISSTSTKVSWPQLQGTHPVDEWAPRSKRVRRVVGPWIFSTVRPRCLRVTFWVFPWTLVRRRLLNVSVVRMID